MDVAIPKITDISSVKGISTLLALPLICVAYILQTGASIGWEGSAWLDVSTSDSEQIQLNRLILIFILKSLWISFFALIAYSIITYVHISTDFPFLQITAIILIAFALFGMFAGEEFIQLKTVNNFWFYSFIVWGVFLQTIKEQLDTDS